MVEHQEKCTNIMSSAIATEKDICSSGLNSVALSEFAGVGWCYRQFITQLQAFREQIPPSSALMKFPSWVMKHPQDVSKSSSISTLSYKYSLSLVPCKEGKKTGPPRWQLLKRCHQVARMPKPSLPPPSRKRTPGDPSQQLPFNSRRMPGLSTPTPEAPRARQARLGLHIIADVSGTTRREALGPPHPPRGR